MAIPSEHLIYIEKNLKMLEENIKKAHTTDKERDIINEYISTIRNTVVYTYYIFTFYVRSPVNLEELLKDKDAQRDIFESITLIKRGLLIHAFSIFDWALREILRNSVFKKKYKPDSANFGLIFKEVTSICHYHISLSGDEKKLLDAAMSVRHSIVHNNGYFYSDNAHKPLKLRVRGIQHVIQHGGSFEMVNWDFISDSIMLMVDILVKIKNTDNWIKRSTSN